MSNIDYEDLGSVPSPAAKAPVQDDDSLWRVIQIPVIMKIIFSYLCLNDLKNFRLVSYVCSQVGSTALFKKASRLVLGSIQMEHLKRLINIIQTSSSFPCTKFCLRTGQTQNPAEDAPLKEFFHVVSPFITELEIDKHVGHTTFSQNPNTKIQYPNLTAIKIMHKCLMPSAKQDSKNWIKDVKFLRNVFTHAPLLDTLAIKSCNYNVKFINTFLNALNKRQGRKIKNLELRGLVETQQLKLATSLGFSLSTVVLEFLNITDISPDSFSSFLESQTYALQELEINSFPTNKPDVRFTFPRMNALAVLKVSCKFNTGINFLNIVYAEQFPALVQLNLSTYNPKFLGAFLGYSRNPPRCDTVTMIELPKGITTLPDFDNFEIISKVTNVFPNLKKLSVPAFEDIMFQLNHRLKSGIYLRNLQELILRKGNQNACLVALTGYRNNELGIIENHIEDHEELLYQEKYREPLDFLHNIKVLKIEQELERDFDLVYYLGLKKLRSLKCLDLRRKEPSINPCKVNEQTLVKMREQFEVLVLEADIIRGKKPKQWKRERSVDCLRIESSTFIINRNKGLNKSLV